MENVLEPKTLKKDINCVIFKCSQNRNPTEIQAKCVAVTITLTELMLSWIRFVLIFIVGRSETKNCVILKVGVCILNIKG